MKFHKFSEVSHLFPENSWAVVRQKSTGDMGDDIVLVIDTDIELTNLDLDAPIVAFKDRFDDYETYLSQELMLCILIQGNLKAKNIFNYETDGSTGLMVLGNLETDNMVVGGQEIYVTGDLTVNECFWGHYNHGELVVEGKISAKVFVDTEEYHIDYKRFEVRENVLIANRISDSIESDDEADPYPRETVAALFDPECVADESDLIDEVYGWNDWLWRHKMLELMQENKPLLLPFPVYNSSESLINLPKIFNSVSFASEEEFEVQKLNFDKLFEVINRTYEHETIAFEWQDFTISFDIKGRKNLSYENIDVNYSENEIKALRSDGLLFTFSRRGAESGIQKVYSLFNKSEKFNFVAMYKAPENGAGYNHLYKSPFQDLAETVWKEILDRAEKGAYYFDLLKQQVTYQEVNELLTLPIISEKYNDYWDSDKCNFWDGNFNYGFRQNGARDCVASLDIGVERKEADDDIRKYFFRFNDVANPTHIQLYYNSSQEELTTDRYRHFSTKQYVSLLDWELYREALKWYKKAPQKIREANDNHVEENQDEEKERKRIADKRRIAVPVPLQKLTYQGIPFRVLNLIEAHEIIGDLTDFQGEKIYDVFEDTWRFPDQENAVFLFTDDDVATERFQLDYGTEDHPDIFILGFIFGKNLKVEKHIEAYDSDNSPAFIVLGQVETVNIKLYGSVHYIGNGLTCDTLWGFYNHGELFVKGPLSAWLVYADDMRIHFDHIYGVGALISSGRPDILLNTKLKKENGESINVENYFPSTHKLSDIIADQYLIQNEYGEYELNEAGPDDVNQVMTEGGSIIDHEKESRYQYQDFEERLNKGFDYLCALPEMATENLVTASDTPELYYCQVFEHAGYKYRQMIVSIDSGFKIRMRAVQALGVNQTQLVLEYMDDDNEPRYQWEADAESDMLEMKCVKRAMLTAIEKLSADAE